jgi:uncharacterized lipoprotein YehR (DUF1307 family)
MLKTCLLRSPLAFACVCLVALAGCGGTKPIQLTGKIVPPANVKLEETDTINLQFVPVDKTGKSAATTFTYKDQTFTCKDIVPGKYKIAVQFVPYQGSKDSEARTAGFKKTNKNLNSENTKLTYEVTGDAQQAITLDLTSDTVTKQ